MSDPALDAFGLMLVERVRDYVIHEWDGIIDGHGKDIITRHVREIMGTSDEECRAKVQLLLPMIVDATLHYFLWMLETEESLSLTYSAPDGQALNLAQISDGLAGELYASRGWIMRFSKERHAPTIE